MLRLNNICNKIEHKEYSVYHNQQQNPMIFLNRQLTFLIILYYYQVLQSFKQIMSTNSRTSSIHNSEELNQSQSAQTSVYSASTSLKIQDAVSMQDNKGNLTKQEDNQGNHSEKKSTNLLLSYAYQTLQQQEKYSFQPQQVIAKHCKSLLTCQQREHSVSFICFGSKKVILWQSDIQSYKNTKKVDYFDVSIHCQEIIQEVVKKLCRTQYNIQILRIKPETFVLEAAQRENQAKININSQSIDKLLKYGTVWLRRVERKVEKNGPMTEYQKQKKEEEERIQILSPDQQNIIELIDRNKTVAHLKQQIASNYYQIIGEMLLFTYSQFKLLSNCTKISQLPQKVVEIYQKEIKFIDPAFIKQQAISINKKNSQSYQIIREQVDQGNLEPIFVNESSLFGQLTLGIFKNDLIEKYRGGLMGFLKRDRARYLPLITLIGMQVAKSTLRLQFHQKDGPLTCQYTFTYQSSLKQVVTNILIVIRNFNHQIQMLV